MSRIPPEILIKYVKGNHGLYQLRDTPVGSGSRNYASLVLLLIGEVWVGRDMYDKYFGESETAKLHEFAGTINSSIIKIQSSSFEIKENTGCTSASLNVMKNELITMRNLMSDRMNQRWYHLFWPYKSETTVAKNHDTESGCYEPGRVQRSTNCSEGKEECQ